MAIVGRIIFRSRNRFFAYKFNNTINNEIRNFRQDLAKKKIGLRGTRIKSSAGVKYLSFDRLWVGLIKFFIGVARY